MRTIQMTLDDELVQTVDKFVKNLHMTRSAFTRQALQQSIARIKIQRLEEKHRQGYLRKPTSANEFDVWEKEQKWSAE